MEDLIAYTAGLTTVRQSAAIELHLLSCAGCLDRLTEANRLYEALEETPGPAVSPGPRRVQRTGRVRTLLEVVREATFRPARSGFLVLRPALAASEEPDRPPVEVLEWRSGSAVPGRPLVHRIEMSPSVERGGRLYLALRLARTGRGAVDGEAVVVVAVRSPTGRIQRACCAGRLEAGRFRLAGVPLEGHVTGAIDRVWVFIRRTR